MKNDNTFFWLFLGTLSIVFVAIFGASFYYHNNKRKKRVGSIEENFYKNSNIFDSVIQKQRSQNQNNENNMAINTVSGNQKMSKNYDYKDENKSHIVSTNSSYLSVPPTITKNVSQFQKMARSVCILTNAIKNEKNLKENIFVKVDEKIPSNDNVNVLKLDSKDEERKTISEIQSDNLLKDNVLFKDIQAEEDELRQEAKRRGIDEDSYVYHSMKRIPKSSANVSIKNEGCFKDYETKNIDKNTFNSTDTSSLKQARELLKCDILHKDIQAEEEKKKEEVRRRGFDAQSNTSTVS